jgi:uncharacterized protein
MEQINVLIGRKKETAALTAICHSPKSEFVAVYGRRRVGKTFLIREFFNYRFSFELTGMSNTGTQQQLYNFHTMFLKQSDLVFEKAPAHWLEAFQRLIAHLEQLDKDAKKIIFFDEMPWLDTREADFITGLEHFWNSWATSRKDIILIACGSAASWIVNDLINNTGGLHNRITRQLKIEPFTLGEAEAMLLQKNAVFNRYQVIQLYMALGGIPVYLDAVQPGLSAAQNIQQLFFDKAAPLKNEFFNLYRSLFKKHEVYEKVVEVLSSKTMGLQRTELAKHPKLSSGGTLTKVLSDLEQCGFITAYTDLYSKQKNTLYRLSDYYTAFYFRFIQSGKYRGEHAWMGLLDNPLNRAWQGFAFEQVCIDHVPQIKKAIGISGIMSSHVSWNGTSGSKKAQVDLLIDRRDEVINICEAKFSINPFSISKDYAEKLREKIGVFKTAANTKKSVFLTFITTYGIEKNQYALQLVQNEVTMDALFDDGLTGTVQKIAERAGSNSEPQWPEISAAGYNTSWSVWDKIQYVLKASPMPIKAGTICDVICRLDGIEAGSPIVRKLYMNITATLHQKHKAGLIGGREIVRSKASGGFLYAITEA